MDPEAECAEGINPEQFHTVENGAIGVIDSGVGGLTVLTRLVALLPHQPFLYFADNACCPYGALPETLIQKRILAIADRMAQARCRLIVIACNTATSAAIHKLREKLSIPVVGMEPAIKPAQKASKTRHIAVLGTQNTLRGEKLKILEKTHGNGLSIHHIVGHGLVQLVETNQLQGPVTERAIREILKPLNQFPIDVIVLGCTHYPFLRDAIRKCAPQGARIIDPAPAVAEQTKRILGETQKDPLSPTTPREGSILFASSAPEPHQEQERLRQFFLRFQDILKREKS